MAESSGYVCVRCGDEFAADARPWFVEDEGYVCDACHVDADVLAEADGEVVGG